MRFNDHWLYCPDQVQPDTADKAFETVTLPHTNRLLPHHNFCSSEYAFISTYRKHFRLPESLDGRHVFLVFDGVMLASTVTINGHQFPEYRGGFTACSYDITPYLNVDDINTVTVLVDSRERADIPPYGNVVDYMTFGGIYRDVWLQLVDPCSIDNVFVHSNHVLTDAPQIAFDVRIANRHETTRSCILQVALLDESGGVVRDLGQWNAQIEAGSLITVSGEEVLPPNLVQLWSLESPVLYRLRVALMQDGQPSDLVNTRFGFREAEFREDGGFYLNGSRIDLVGLNRHQTYPYIGAAAPPRLQRRDAEIIKYDLACNIVRTAHYPQSPHFLNRCDEIGLLVFTEIPGWQHIGDTDWQELSLYYLEALIERDRNHPAVILWGVRINETPDHDAFYSRTNALARKLDPTRPTGGVRDFQESKFLEDVFTMNDFSNSIQQPVNVPHLVTEFNGHMFPTKAWDHEERVIEHALRHARITDAHLGMPDVSGAIGWCAFDYNTHFQFGSGDRICYHGVMDIFRLPKFAARFYESQQAPESRVVLHAATRWAMGDRDTSRIDQLVVFSNCDSVDVYVGDNFMGHFLPDRKHFPNLPHAPFQIPLGTGNLTWGQHLPDLLVQGKINGELVAEHRIAADSLPYALDVTLDDDQLYADGADMTRLAVCVVDRFGNPLPYTDRAVWIALEGPVTLVGDNPLVLQGGQGAVFIKAGYTGGRVSICVKTDRLPEAKRTLIVAQESSD